MTLVLSLGIVEHLIPPFGPEGLLPPGDYEVSFRELEESLLVCGPGDREQHLAWDASWRKRLVENLEVLGWRLTVGSRHDEEYLTADAVILAIPASPAARLLGGVPGRPLQ